MHFPPEVESAPQLIEMEEEGFGPGAVRLLSPPSILVVGWGVFGAKLPERAVMGPLIPLLSLVDRQFSPPPPAFSEGINFKHLPPPHQPWGIEKTLLLCSRYFFKERSLHLLKAGIRWRAVISTSVFEALPCLLHGATYRVLTKILIIP